MYMVNGELMTLFVITRQWSGRGAMRKKSELQNNEEAIERKINMFNEKERLKWKPLRTLTIKKKQAKQIIPLIFTGFSHNR